MLSKLKNYHGAIILCIIALTSVAYAYNDKLTFYIHPRYIIFTLAMSIVALLCIGVTIFLQPLHIKTTGSYAANIIAVVVVFIMCLPPATTLSSRIAQNRGALDGAAVTSTKKIISTRTEKLNLEEWSSLISQTADKYALINKEANFSGFVIPGDRNDIFYMGKFVVTCCTVDARPVTVPVQFEGWRQEFSDDQWVNVEGLTIMKDGVITVQAKTVNAISRPKDPYAF